MESFFASLKHKELYRKKYRSEKEFRTAVDDYMKFYNSKRLMPQINTRLLNKRKLIISAFKPKIGNLKLELRGSNSVLFWDCIQVLRILFFESSLMM